ncbi:hypothetical protein E6O75_ATG01292 [Venturia nashicola]|uniref:Ras-GAP domain-containing protein n=1 Tax=Venturia nashicola TaxID=86259 RepID=A0A4Z1PUW5_9PEZI|nr:hypothetical protein E6O75_ATG01292 [Venturia nashicola]
MELRKTPEERTLLEVETLWLLSVTGSPETAAMEHQHNRSTPNPRSRRKHNSDTEFLPHRVKSREDIGYSHRNPLGTTIRAVTPDLIPEGQAVSANELEQRFIPGTQTSQPTSPKSGVRESPGQGTTGIYRLRSGSNNENRHGMIMRDQARPRTRTLDELGNRDTSPPGVYSKSKHRIGSGHSISSASFTTMEDAVTSIGHPAIIPPPWSIDQRAENTSRHRVSSKPQPRDGESNPATNSSSSNGRQSQTSHDAPIPLTDTRKMLALMKSTRGRMEGPLAFRRSGTAPWSISYCSINDEAGSLVYEPNNQDLHYRTLIPDLRGCNIKPQWDAESHMPYLDVGPQNSKLKIHLRPHSQDEFDSWFAALLCWQPIRPKGIHNRMAKPVSTAPSERRLTESRRHSEISLLKDSPIIKVGKMIFWDTNVSYSYAGTPKGGKPQPSRMQSFGSRRWRRVSCTLRENGELKLYSEQDVITMVSCVQLSQLCRSAVQRLDPSVLDNDFCLAIYPQYSSVSPATTTTSNSQPLLRPIFLSLESRVLYEVWLVLLRAFTIPQLYGPKQILSDESSSSDRSMSSGQSPPVADVFRMERSLSIRVIESRLAQPITSADLQEKSRSDKDEKKRKEDGKEKEKEKDAGAYYAEVLLDGETRSKTMMKTLQESLFWREEFEFVDLPAVLSVASIVLKKRPPSVPQNERSMQKEQRRIHDAINSGDGGGGQTGLTFDTQVGKVDIYLDDLEAGKAVEKWWPLLSTHGQRVGEVLVCITTDESVILMARDYQPLSELLHRFANGLTLQIAQMVSGELKRLSEYLLNIFQVSSCAGEWIMSLIEEEIDGTFRETPASRTRLSRRAGSNDSGEGTQFGPPLDRELLVRDLGKTATVEANLLFRGNTLLTKSLDLHMKRLGKEYLEETLGDKLKEIADKDPICEVDPNRVDNMNDLDRNWRKLINWTSECWKCIYNSAAKCPPELRIIFRHIRSCAEERYGNFLKTVSYSSVSGFLFLRFFCPAILNPKLFGLLKGMSGFREVEKKMLTKPDHPKTNARRTLTLIAKSLQGLANLNTFGSKEQWMEPMNTFLSSHRHEFKSFLDNVCSISTSSMQLVPPPPSYSTPLAILNRLPLTSKEGFPSLPYLVDHARNFAGLVSLWLDHAGQVGNIQDTDGDLLKFHLTCIALRQRTEDCLLRAERAERPSSRHSVKWEELVENLETGMGYTRREHSRMNSASTSIAEERHSDDPQSPMHGRGHSIDLPSESDTRTRSKHGQQHPAQQPQQSSPSSHATSPCPTSGDSQNEDDFTPLRSPQDDYAGTAYASVGKTPARTHGNYGSYSVSGFVHNQDPLASLRDIPRVGSRQASSHQQQLQQHLQQMQSPKRGFTPVNATPQPTSRIGNTPGDRSGTHFEPPAEEQNWLGDTAMDESGWSEERQDRSEGERAAFNNAPHNARPTRRPEIQQRQAQVQLQAELIEPGAPRDRRTLRGEPRRDWAGDERQKRVERTEGMNQGNSREGGSSLASMMASIPLRPGSRSQPVSRGESRQVSSSSSDNEGTTALPKMKQAVEKEKEAKSKDKHPFGLFSKKKKG